MIIIIIIEFSSTTAVTFAQHWGVIPSAVHVHKQGIKRVNAIFE